MYQKYHFREQDLSKFSRLCNIPEEVLGYLETRGFLNMRNVMEAVVRNDYLKLKKIQHPKLKAKRIIQLLIEEYGLTDSQVKAIIHEKWHNVYYCSECGIQISKVMSIANDGKCDKCVKRMIDEALK